MKLRKNKKGFTIVELVIVIAVIGVLTAILVPTFVSLNKKANKASDNSLVTNLNTALASKEAEDGAKNATMNDAVQDLYDYGFVLKNLAAKSEEDLLWSMKDNKFYLSDAEEVKQAKAAGKAYEFWRIQNNDDDSDGYSIYAGLKFTATSANVSVGFDAGDWTTITSVNYSNTSAREVVIRTNGAYTTLTINGANDTVKHYGNANVVNVTAVAMNSYHENGSVATLNAKAGKINVEPDAFVGVVAVDKDASSSTLKVENSGTVFGTEVITYDAEGGEHAVVENPTEEQQAIAGSIETTSSSDVIRISTADALINIASAQSQGIVKGALKLELANDIDLTGKTWIPFGADLSNDEHHAFNGSIDGKNHNIIGLSNGAYKGVQLANHTTGQIGEHYGFISNSGEVSLSNINFKAVNINSDNATVCAAVIAYAESSNITLSGINVEGKVTGSDKVAGLIGYAKVDSTVVINNCSVKAAITAHEYRIGGFFGFASYANITINNSSFGGSLAFENSKNVATTYCAVVGSVHATGGNGTTLTVSNFTLDSQNVQANVGHAAGKQVFSSNNIAMAAIMSGTIVRTGITDNVISASQWSVALTSK